MNTGGIHLIKKIFKLAVKHIDKIAHCVISAVIVLVLGLFIPLWIAVLVAVLLGLVKEILDKYVLASSFSIPDLVADTLGIILAVAALLLSGRV